MIMTLFIWLASIALAVVGSLTFWPVTTGLDFYKPIVLFVGGYVAATILALGFIGLLSLAYSYKKEYAKPSKFAGFLFGDLTWFIVNHSFVRVKVKGLNKIPNNQKFLIVCNHRSNYDPLIMAKVLHRYNIAFITKRSNYKIPIGRRIINAMCFLPIDRDNLLQSLQVMKRAGALIANGQANIGVFPEGTRQHDQVIGDFHEGVFNIALKNNAPIVVTTIYDAHNIHDRKAGLIPTVRMRVLATLTPDELMNKGAKEVSDLVKNMMIEDLENLKK